MTDEDPRPTFSRAADQAQRVVGGVRTEQLGQPTPCAEFDVRTLLGHLLSVFRRMDTVASGGESSDVPHVTTGIPDDGWLDAVRDARTGVERTWADDAVLAKTLAFPFGTLPGAAAMQVFTFEVGVHTWDLVKATGQPTALDPELGAAALATAHQGLPAEPRENLPFAPVVPVPDDAEVYDKLAAWLGRDPSAWA